LWNLEVHYHVHRSPASPRSCVIFPKILLFDVEELLSPAQLPSGGPPLVDCTQLIIQNIRSYPPYLEAVFSTPNLSTRHAILMTWFTLMVFIFGENTNAAKRNTGALLEARKEVGLEVNTGKIKCMFIFCHQNAKKKKSQFYNS
jgi:hypothetical protein